MGNDDVGTIDSESEDDVEQNKETTVQIEEKVQQSAKDTKPAIAGLPMDDASDAWMSDDVGTIDSDSEDQEEENKETAIKIEEKIQQRSMDTKPAIAGLPMDDASEAWMNDDVGTIDSESEDEDEKIREATVQTKEKIDQPSKVTKPSIAGLPMDDASDAWMNDDVGTIDSDDEDSVRSLDKEKKITVEKIEEFTEKLKVKAAHSGFAGLPVDDVSDTWMNDDFVAIEDDEDCIEEDPSGHPLKDAKRDSIPDYDENDKE